MAWAGQTELREGGRQVTYTCRTVPGHAGQRYPSHPTQTHTACLQMRTISTHLVDNKEVLIFVHNFQWQRLWRRLQRWRRQHVAAHHIPRLHSDRGLGLQKSLRGAISRPPTVAQLPAHEPELPPGRQPSRMPLTCCCPLTAASPPSLTPAALPSCVAAHLLPPVDRHQPSLDRCLQPRSAGGRQLGGEESVQAQLALLRVGGKERQGKINKGRRVCGGLRSGRQQLGRCAEVSDRGAARRSARHNNDQPKETDRPC